MFQDTKEAFAWIEEKSAQGIRPGLHRMESALSRLGNPERRCKFIHVAGTNGKGSTSAMIASVLQAAGYRTGMFTSPHLVNWNERIQVDGVQISEERFLYWASHLRIVVEKMIADGEEAPSQFEFWTLLAICYFARDECPWFIVWETGLGGRLDATNVVYPLVSVITQIGIDHQEYLGDTLEQIAHEKAGILKAGVPAVCGSLQPEAVAEIEKVAAEKQSRVYRNGRDFWVEELEKSMEGQRFHFSDPYRMLENLPLALVGEHQLQNASTALMTIEVLRQNYATVIDEPAFAEGLQKVHWPGRLERVGEKPILLLDGAHNAQGIEALTKALPHYQYDRLTVIVAMMKEKKVELLAPLLDVTDQLILTKVTENPRSKTAEELLHEVEHCYPGIALSSIPNIGEAIRTAKQQANSTDLILVTGSLYLVAEARAYLTNSNY